MSGRRVIDGRSGKPKAELVNCQVRPLCVDGLAAEAVEAAD